MKVFRLSAGLAVFLTLASLIAGAWPSLADRDIVYSARYYLRPGSKGLSHSHLYRINPGGSRRTQITFGNHDDTDPIWSPNGQWIAFVRDWAVFVMRSNGSSAHAVLGHVATSFATNGEWSVSNWSPDSRTLAVTHAVWDSSGQENDTIYLVDITTGRYQRLPADKAFYWSPNGLRGYLQTADVSQVLVDLKNDHIIPQSSHALDKAPIYVNNGTWPNCVWLDDDHLAALGSKTTIKETYIILFGADSRLLRTVECHWPGGGADPDDMDEVQEIDPGAPSKLYVLYGHDVGDASDRPDNAYYLADLSTGAMQKVTEGEFVVFAPDGNRYCTASPHDTSPFGGTYHGHQREVYTAQLEVGVLGKGEPKEIVSGLVFVAGADWRKHSP